MLIIFDLDDTLIDTSSSVIPYKLKKAILYMVENGLHLENITAAFLQILALNKVSTSSSNALLHFLKLNNADNSFFEMGLKILFEAKLPKKVNVPLMENALETLFSLKKKHELALVTIGKKNLQLLKLKKAGIDTSFFCKIYVCESFTKKAYYKKLLEDFSLTPKHVVVCGDKIKNDLYPAKQLGMHTVHIKWGRAKYIEATEEENTYVDHSIDAMNQLLPIIKNIRVIS